MKTLIGSQSIKYYFPSFRKPKDWDYLTDGNEVSTKDYEYHNNISPGHKWILEQGPVASPEIMLTLKMSHAFWDTHWFKTMNDIRFLQERDVKHIEWLWNELYNYWCFIHNESTQLQHSTHQVSHVKQEIHKITTYNQYNPHIAYLMSCRQLIVSKGIYAKFMVENWYLL